MGLPDLRSGQKENFMNTMLAVLGLGGAELVLIAVVALILFGANKIPTFMKGLGQGIKEFKKASTDMQNELHQAIDVDSHPATPPKRITPPETQARETDAHEAVKPADPSAQPKA